MKIGKDNQPENLIENEAPKDKEERKEPATLWDKLENFWYFYKWHTIIGGVVIIGIIISLFQLIGNQEPDAYMMFVGQNTLFAVEKEKVISVSKEYIDDVDGNGSKNLAFLEITVAVGDNIPQTAFQTNADAAKRFSTEVTAGKSVIYLLEESYYEKAKSLGILEELSNVIDPDDIPNNTYDKYGVRISELDFFKREGFASFPDDTILCIRQSPDDDAIAYGRSLEFWNSNRKLFAAMFDFRSQAEKEVKTFDTSKSDVTIMYCGFERVYESTGKKLASYGKSQIGDLNKDGAITLDMDYRVLEKSESSAYEANGYSAKYFMHQVNNSGNVIYLLEESFYNALYQSGRILPLVDVFGRWLLVESKDGCGIEIGKLDYFSKYKGFSDFDEALVLCVVKKTDNHDADFYENSLAFYKNIVSYKENKPVQ